MNSGQLILILASFFVLSILVLMVNSNLLEDQDQLGKSKATFNALLEAKNIFEEIKTKSFDENYLAIAKYNKDSLTNFYKFGPEGESYPQFDDIDDYQNYEREVNYKDVKRYKLKLNVNYISEDNPNQIILNNSFFKQVSILCFDESQNQIFELKQIFSIW